MRSVKTKDTGPEIEVRRLLHAAGLRYRLHAKELPGKPDIVFRGRKKAIFVHGCFWHSHGCDKGRAPKSKQDYWLPKLEANRERDSRNVKALTSLGWSTLTIWACELKDIDLLRKNLLDFVLDAKITIDSAD